MLASFHSARRVETRRAEWARRSWSAQLRRSNDSVAAPSQQRWARPAGAPPVGAPSQHHRIISKFKLKLYIYIYY